MRLLIPISVMLLASCGQKASEVRTEIPTHLTEAEDGWLGPTPTTAEQFSKAAEAEKSGRLAANRKLNAIREISNDE